MSKNKKRFTYYIALLQDSSKPYLSDKTFNVDPQFILDSGYMFCVELPESAKQPNCYLSKNIDDKNVLKYKTLSEAVSDAVFSINTDIVEIDDLESNLNAIFNNLAFIRKDKQTGLLSVASDNTVMQIIADIFESAEYEDDELMDEKEESYLEALEYFNTIKFDENGVKVKVISKQDGETTVYVADNPDNKFVKSAWDVVKKIESLIGDNDSSYVSISMFSKSEGSYNYSLNIVNSKSNLFPELCDALGVDRDDEPSDAGYVYENDMGAIPTMLIRFIRDKLSAAGITVTVPFIQGSRKFNKHYGLEVYYDNKLVKYRQLAASEVHYSMTTCAETGKKIAANPEDLYYESSKEDVICGFDFV